jgi:hypothetical protein
MKGMDMEQLTRKQAIKVFESKVWEEWSDAEIVKFQLFQDCLAVPFDRFHEAIEKVLGRPVFTHEFAQPEYLIMEYQKICRPPTFQEIIDMIPEKKMILVLAQDPLGK